jgi:hypothetical protein
LVLLILGAVFVSAGLALWSSTARAGLDLDEEPYYGTRYRVRIVKVDLDPAGSGPPLTLESFPRELPDAIVPLAESAAAAGHFGAVPYRTNLDAAVAEGTRARVLYRGETESAPGKKCSIHHGQRFPVTMVQLRGNQTTVTTSFEKVGFSLDLTPKHSGQKDDLRPGRVHDVKIEFSAVTATDADGAPVISSVSSYGTIVLPDAYTSVLSFVERVPGELLRGRQTETDAAGAAPVPDAFVQYFVLITRLDLTAK